MPKERGVKANRLFKVKVSYRASAAAGGQTSASPPRGVRIPYLLERTWPGGRSECPCRSAGTSSSVCIGGSCRRSAGAFGLQVTAVSHTNLLKGLETHRVAVFTKFIDKYDIVSKSLCIIFLVGVYGWIPGYRWDIPSSARLHCFEKVAIPKFWDVYDEHIKQASSNRPHQTPH